MINKYSVIIPAAGSSQRFGENKLHLKLPNGNTVIEETINIFLKDKRCQQIIVATNEPRDLQQKINTSKLETCPGGKTRFLSVKNGCQLVKEKYVFVHDGARPFLSSKILDAICQNDFWFGSVVLKLRDSCFQKEKKITYLNRDLLFCVQTPQFFQTSILLQAYKTATGLENDELEFVTRAFPHLEPTLVEGSWINRKITFRSDWNE